MENIDLRKIGREGLKQIRSQVVRLKKMGKTGKEIEELTGVRQNRVSEIWTAYQRESESSLDQETMNQQRLIRFMEHLVRASERKVFLIRDNLKVHHGKLVTAWLEKYAEKIEVFCLPSYAPEYNPTEYLNHALKLSVHSGLLPYMTEDIFHKIRSFMRKLQYRPAIVSNFFLHLKLSYLFSHK